jgi:hypothetical protein
MIMWHSTCKHVFYDLSYLTTMGKTTTNGISDLKNDFKNDCNRIEPIIKNIF